MNALERLESANPVADADRLLSGPGAMDAFVLAVKERSGILHTTSDQAPIEVPTGSNPTEIKKSPAKWRRRLVPALVAAVVALVLAGVGVAVLGGSNEPDVASVSPTVSFTGAACEYSGSTEFALGDRVTFTFVNASTQVSKFELWKVPDGTTAADISERGVIDVVLAERQDLAWAIGGADDMRPGDQEALTRTLGFEGQHAVVCMDYPERNSETATFFTVTGN